MKMSPRLRTFVKEWVEPAIIAVILALLVRIFIAQPFKIPTGSMRPTVMERDKIFVNKYIYRFTEPKIGDIIVFKQVGPDGKKKDLIKRLIGKEGDKVEIINGRIKRNGEFIDTHPVSEFYYRNNGDYGALGQEINVPEDSFYVLGDNSANSKDSRIWGFVPKKKLIGKAFIVWWPPKRIQLLK